MKMFVAVAGLFLFISSVEAFILAQRSPEELQIMDESIMKKMFGTDKPNLLPAEIERVQQIMRNHEINPGEKGSFYEEQIHKMGPSRGFGGDSVSKKHRANVQPAPQRPQSAPPVMQGALVDDAAILGKLRANDALTHNETKRVLEIVRKFQADPRRVDMSSTARDIWGEAQKKHLY